MQRTLYRRTIPQEGPSCRLVAVGDIMLSGEVARRHTGEPEAAALFGDLPSILRSGDITFGNLETPLCDVASERTLFRGHPGMATTLASAGFNVLSLANNHALEYGPEGLLQCATALESSGIRVLGAGGSRDSARRPIVMECRGLRVGLLGFGRTLQEQRDPSAPGFVEWEEPLALRSILAIRDRVDCVVVSLHIGLMWLDYPKPEFKGIADRLVAAGADVVLMHHAHVLQGYRAAEGRLVIYNLGNFIADIEEGEMRGVESPQGQRDSAVFIVDLDRRGVVEVGAVPIWITDGFTVDVADEERGGRIIARLERISEDVRTGRYLGAYARQRAERNAELTLGWLLNQLKSGHWGELARSVLRARPEHLGMFGRYATQKIRTLWRKQRTSP